MTDIVKRLRSIRGNFIIPIESPPLFKWAEDAADEIERLTAENERLGGQIKCAINVGHNDDCMFCGFKDRELGVTVDGPNTPQTPEGR